MIIDSLARMPDARSVSVHYHLPVITVVKMRPISSRYGISEGGTDVDYGAVRSGGAITSRRQRQVQSLADGLAVTYMVFGP